jgi:hypothetical protein
LIHLQVVCLLQSGLIMILLLMKPLNDLCKLFMVLYPKSF